MDLALSTTCYDADDPGAHDDAVADDVDNCDAEFELFFTVVPDEAWRAAHLFMMLLSFVGIVLLGQLVRLHIFLCKCSDNWSGLS